MFLIGPLLILFGGDDEADSICLAGCSSAFFQAAQAQDKLKQNAPKVDKRVKCRNLKRSGWPR